jgi:hypothetical protein
MAKYITTEIEVYLSVFDDEELIEELEDRGYYVSADADITAVEHYWNRGEQKEALILLERKFPNLRGLSNLV